MNRPPPRSTLFPHPTLLRSPYDDRRQHDDGVDRAAAVPAVARGGIAGGALAHDAGRALHQPLPVPLTRWIRVVLAARSEEHTSELQSQSNLVCRLLLEKKKT